MGGLVSLQEMDVPKGTGGLVGNPNFWLGNLIMGNLIGIIENYREDA